MCQHKSRSADGVPRKYPFKNGDIVTIDMVVNLERVIRYIFGGDIYG